MSATSNPPARGAAPGAAERLAVAALLGANVVLRVVYVFAFRFDSDETQHLHVAWGWAHGLVQYRDLFDNHAPLFHLLSAPLVAALPEGPRELYAMRLAMLPISAALVALCFVLGRRLFSPRVGLWGAALAGLFPKLFLRSVEYRPDNLWALLWLLAIAVLVAGRATRARSFAVGALLGAALAVSVKTLVLLASLSGAACVTLLLSHGWRDRARLRAAAELAASAAAGFAIAPAAILLVFAALGALDALRYCLVSHNSLAGLGLWDLGPRRLVEFGALSLGLCAVAAVILRGAREPRTGRRRALVFLAAAETQAGLGLLWPMWEPEHALPYYPLLVLFAVAGGCALSGALSRSASGAWGTAARRSAWLGGAFALFEVGALVARLGAPRNALDPTLEVVSEVERLTDPGEPVMDLKGETVFRRRPFYFALEQVTRRKIRRGMIADTIEDSVERTHTCVAVLDNAYFPPRGRAFLNRAFVPVGELRVCGGIVGAGADDSDFEVWMPGRYAIVAEDGPASGSLDGRAYDGPRFLAAGYHRFRRSAGYARLAFVWARAVDRGFSPFPARRRDPGAPSSGSADGSISVARGVAR